MMLTATRGVSLGLGNMKLSELSTTQKNRAVIQRNAKPVEIAERIAKKQVDEKTLLAACKAVAFSTVIIVLGMLITVIGYFDIGLSEEMKSNTGKEKSHTEIALLQHYQLKILQYAGPIIMGIGTFILIISCVMTLESRDKYKKIVYDGTISTFGKRSMNQSENSRSATYVHTQGKQLLDTNDSQNSAEKILNEPKLSKVCKYSSTSCLPQPSPSDSKIFRCVGPADYENKLLARDYESTMDGCKLGDHFGSNTLSRYRFSSQNIIADVHSSPIYRSLSAKLPIALSDISQRTAAEVYRRVSVSD